MGTYAYQAYKNATVQTSPAKLLIMLYDGLIRNLELADNAIFQGNLQEAHQKLIKAQDIVLELQNTLNMDYEISHSLASLYDYFYRRLVEANVQKDRTPASEILPMIKGLRESWYQASLQLNGASRA